MNYITLLLQVTNCTRYGHTLSPPFSRQIAKFTTMQTYPEEQIKGEIPMKQAHGVRSPIFGSGSAVRANAPTTGLMC